MQLSASVAALLLSFLVSPSLAVIVAGEQRAQPATLPVSSGAVQDNSTTTNHLAKRYNGKASFFAPGLGACGQYHRESDFIVALSTVQFGSNSGPSSPWCFQMITLSYGGKTTNAQIVDACPGCPSEGLDLSPALFRFFAPESVGIFYGLMWDKAGAAPAPAPSPTRQPAPTPTYTPPPPPPTSTYTPPSSTYTPPPPSSTYTPPPPTTSSTSTTSSSSTRASITPTLNSTLSIANATMSSNASSIASLPTAVTLTTTPTLVGGNLDRLSQIVLGLGGLVGAAAAGAGEGN